MKKYFSAFMISVVLLSNSGCASIVSGKTSSVDIRSNPEGAAVFINEMEMGSTPMIIDLKRKQRHTIKVVKDGYTEEIRTTRKGFNWWFVGNVIFGGIVGIIVDFATGAVYKVEPEKINISLTPTSPDQIKVKS